MKIEDYNKYYIQGSDHYLIPKDEFKELFNEMINWKEESQKLPTTANNCKRLKEEYNKIQKAYESTFSDYQQLKDNWNKLKEYIGIKLYNVEYLQKLCGCRIDDEIHMILDIIKKEMQELESSDSNAKD